MPKKTIDFSKTVIYKIQHKEIDDLLYVGSTTNFTQRKSEHKSNSTNSNAQIYNAKLYKTIRDNGGWDAFNMVILKPFPCQNFNEAHTEEDKVMREMKSSLNTKRAYVSPEERREYLKQYNYDNRDKRSEYGKEHYQLNKDDISERHKAWREENVDKIKEHYELNKDYICQRQRESYQKNRDELCRKQRERRNRYLDKLLEKFECPCGGRYSHEGRAKHFKTKIHQDFLKKNH